MKEERSKGGTYKFAGVEIVNSDKSAVLNWREARAHYYKGALAEQSPLSEVNITKVFSNTPACKEICNITHRLQEKII